MSATEPQSTRRAARRTTAWQAECRINGRVLSGAVLDISGHGAFFSPGGDAVDDLLNVGAPVAISFDQEVNLAGLDLPCRVRWVGFSPTHGRSGFGLEFATDAL